MHQAECRATAVGSCRLAARIEFSGSIVIPLGKFGPWVVVGRAQGGIDDMDDPVHEEREVDG
eukprot:1841098-Heterocapsa_arctica.AAC.1